VRLLEFGGCDLGINKSGLVSKTPTLNMIVTAVVIVVKREM
jgi:hypothetical protein